MRCEYCNPVVDGIAYGVAAVYLGSLPFTQVPA